MTAVLHVASVVLIGLVSAAATVAAIYGLVRLGRLILRLLDRVLVVDRTASDDYYAEHEDAGVEVTAAVPPWPYDTWDQCLDAYNAWKARQP